MILKEQLKDSKEFISPMEARRMGKLMKAAHLSSLRALKAAGIERPDAIVTATSRGMFEISRQFLSDIHTGGEELLKPTLFMQSTHNTIGSALAIRTGCHGYNITYSHGEDSMKWAVRDAERLIRTGQAVSVLVGSYDESTPDFSAFSESFLESSTPIREKSFGRITAAVTTGPANGPLPASSIPQTHSKPSSIAASSYSSVIFISEQKSSVFPSVIFYSH